MSGGATKLHDVVRPPGLLSVLTRGSSRITRVPTHGELAHVNLRSSKNSEVAATNILVPAALTGSTLAH